MLSLANKKYEQTSGRYLQSDPVGLAGGINTYNYVYNNPNNYFDRNGLTPEGTAVGAVVGAAGGAIAGAFGGAVVGTVAGPVGTFGGGFAGAVQGAVDGAIVGGVIGNAVSDWASRDAANDEKGDPMDRFRHCPLIDAEVQLQKPAQCPKDNVIDLDSEVACIYQCPTFPFPIVISHVVPSWLGIKTKAQAMNWCPKST